jgi:hypothetical protein
MVPPPSKRRKPGCCTLVWIFLDADCVGNPPAELQPLVRAAMLTRFRHLS